MIYFVQSRTTHLVKIGTTKQFTRRLKALRMEADSEVDVLGIAEGHRPEETSLHQHFKHLRVAGEWFRLEADLQDFIKLNTQAWNGATNGESLHVYVPPVLRAAIGEAARRHRRDLTGEVEIALEQYLASLDPALWPPPDSN